MIKGGKNPSQSRNEKDMTIQGRGKKEHRRNFIFKKGHKMHKILGKHFTEVDSRRNRKPT